MCAWPKRPVLVKPFSSMTVGVRAPAPTKIWPRRWQNVSNKTGLGRGFDSLIPKSVDAAELFDDQARVQKIAVADIVPNADQPRTTFDDNALAGLAESITQHGIIQPLVVTPHGAGKYSIVAGERRWRAAQIAKLDKVPALVRTTKELERLELAIVENVQRVDLSPLEQAVSVERLHQQ